MSADNYLYVRKLDNGKYDITHRFASMYYRDEYPEGNLNVVVRDNLVTKPPQEKQYDTLTEAVMSAHLEASKMDVLEYGVQIQEGLL